MPQSFDAAFEICTPGTRVEVGGVEFEVHQALSSNQLLVRESNTTEFRLIDRGLARLVRHEPSAVTSPSLELAFVPDELKQQAEKWLSKLELIPGQRTYGAQTVANHAKMLEVHPATIYRRLKRHHPNAAISSQLRAQRSDRGGSRLPVDVEAVITGVLEAKFLQRDHYSATACHVMINTALKNKGFAEVSYGTVCSRMSRVNDSRQNQRLSQTQP